MSLHDLKIYEKTSYLLTTSNNRGASLVAQRLKRLPGMQETWVRSLSWEDPLEKEMAAHSSTLAWRIPWGRSLVGYSPWGCKESDTTEWLHFTFLYDWNVNWLFQSCDHCWVFQICWHIECSTLTASSFRIWNSSAGILSPTLAFLEKEMATHSSTLAWRIPWGRSLVGYTPWGCKELDTTGRLHSHSLTHSNNGAETG